MVMRFTHEPRIFFFIPEIDFSVVMPDLCSFKERVFETNRLLVQCYQPCRFNHFDFKSDRFQPISFSNHIPEELKHAT